METKIELKQGDCIELMKGLADKSIDVIITDPPYGINGDYDSYVDTEENLIKLIKAFIPEALRVAKRTCVFTGVKDITLFPRSDWILAWINKAGSGVGRWGFTCWTPILVYGKDPLKGSHPDILVQAGSQGIRKGFAHPFEKPLSTMKWAINRCSNEGDTILDPFMGSGTTGVVCRQLNRNFIGYEISQAYFEIAEKRIREETNQGKL